MGAIFQSLGRTVAAGVVLLILLVLVAGGNVGPSHAWATFVMRWLHVLCGVMWVGLLWYFNFVQIPSMPKIPDEQKPGGKQGDRTDRPVLVPLVCPGHGGHWPAAGNDERLCRPRADVAKAIHGHRHRHVDCPGDGLQCLVHHLAEPEEGPGHRDGWKPLKRPRQHVWPC